ncbi:MAG: hypothetical protein JKY57_05690 [Kordiimonadaceae bacterium]|nr:hypothetical protein [Kordiimonadaceae bacterium]
MTTPSHPFPLIDVSGPARARGEQYAEQASDRIAISINNYRNAFAGINISWEQACGIAASFIPKLEADEKDLYPEIEGIAAGSGYSIPEILALNCRTEIIYGQNNATNDPTDGCTAFAAMPSATANGHTLHAQNWDWRDDCAETTVVLRIRRDNGPDILTVTEAGNLARCGMNSNGIALTGNFLKCEHDNKPGGVPIPFARRHILEQSAYSGAIEVALNTPKSFSSNMIISHGDGECIDIETVPGDNFWIQATNGLLVHANHFEAPSALAKVRDEGLKVVPCSLHRVRRVREYLTAKVGSLTLEHAKEAFSDKFDNPYGVCAEPDTGPGGDNSSTVATILMDVTDQKMWLAVRPYQKHSYSEYGFTD